MNKIQFDRLLKPLIRIYDDIELDLIKNILEKLETYNSVQGSLEWYLEKLMDLGKLDKDNLRILKNHKEEIELTLTEIATSCGSNIDNLDELNSYYEEGLINIKPNRLNKTISISNLINEAIKDTNDIMNLINTKALEGAKESYKNILNKAYVETESGIYTYTESIRNALKNFAKDGIQTVHYKNGKTLSIESVVRRDVITRMNKLVGDVEIEHAKELDTNLVYVDQHLGARVRTEYMKHAYEAHVEWQGKKYMLDGSSDEYQNLYEATGYGEMLGLKGINCYHNMRPTWEWEEIPTRINEIENTKVYEQLQQQRKYERKLRQLKRERLVAKESNNADDYKQVNNKFKEISREFNDWLEQNDLTRDYNREYIVDNIRKNNKIKNNYIDVTQDWLDDKLNDKIINLMPLKNGDKFKYNKIEYIYDGKQVKYDFKPEEIKFGEYLASKKNNIYFNPTINEPDGISTADLTIDSNLYDMKIASGKSKQLLYHNMRGKEKQAHRFLFEVTNSPLTVKDLEEQIENVFKRKDMFFVEIIGIKKDDELKIFKRQ